MSAIFSLIWQPWMEKVEKATLPITSLFIPILFIKKKLTGALIQNKSTSVSAEFLSIPNFTTLFIQYSLDTMDRQTLDMINLKDKH